MEVEVGKPQTSRRKRKNGVDISIEIEVSAPGQTGHCIVWGHGDFATAAGPKVKEPIWKVFHKPSPVVSTVVLLAANKTQKEALEIAKEFVTSKER